MKSETITLKRGLQLTLTEKEARDILDEIHCLYQLRKGGNMWSWPNTAVANLSFALTGFMNERFDKE